MTEEVFEQELQKSLSGEGINLNVKYTSDGYLKGYVVSSKVTAGIGEDLRDALDSWVYDFITNFEEEERE